MHHCNRVRTVEVTSTRCAQGGAGPCPPRRSVAGGVEHAQDVQEEVDDVQVDGDGPEHVLVGGHRELVAAAQQHLGAGDAGQVQGVRDRGRVSGRGWTSPREQRPPALGQRPSPHPLLEPHAALPAARPRRTYTSTSEQEQDGPAVPPQRPLWYRPRPCAPHAHHAWPLVARCVRTLYTLHSDPASRT